jgi:hypothetical protein
MPGDQFSCTLGADPSMCICYAHMANRTDDAATYERSTFSELWATATYCCHMAMTNCHLFVLHALNIVHGSALAYALMALDINKFY